MSDLTERIAADHHLNMVGGCIQCQAEPHDGPLEGYDRYDWWTKHVAEVTEAAVRAQIAADIESSPWEVASQDGPLPYHDQETWMHGANAGVKFSARIAKGGDR